MRTALVSATVIAAGMLVVSAGPPALAYDKDALVHAAGHMILNEDVPASLGAFADTGSFSSFDERFKLGLCQLKDASVPSPGGARQYTLSMFEKGTGVSLNSMTETVAQFKGAKAAIKAFDVLKAKAATCVGTQANSWTGSDGVVNTWTSVTTNGVVPAVTQTGVESVFINVNYDDGSANEVFAAASDTYAVYTLLNDVIISTQYTTGSDDNVGTKDRKKVDKVAFTAIDRWIG
jgi:hypothetical protein